MQHIHYILLSGLLVSFVSLVGVFFVKENKIGHFVNKHLGLMSAASAGIFVVTSFLLIRETFELLSPLFALASFVIGIIFYSILNRSLGGHHHRHRGDDPIHRHEHEKRAAWKILIGDFIHNIADGLFLVVSFGTGTSIGLTSALSILLHETPQEISEFIVLKKSGYTTRQASYRNFVTALSIFIGIGIGFLITHTETLQGFLLGISATFFLGIVFQDLFPLHEISNMKNHKKLWTSFIIGIIIMATIAQTLGHSHHHDEDEHHDDHVIEHHHHD